jgi:1,4-dihydroxy-2-naphthoate octaprenyltransferase
LIPTTTEKERNKKRTLAIAIGEVEATAAFVCFGLFFFLMDIFCTVGYSTF